MKTGQILRIRPPRQGLRGITRTPGDKSISHRVLILGMLANGENRVQNWLSAGDTLATLNAARLLGVPITQDGDVLVFRGGNITPPWQAIDCANAGTAMRLLAGMLAGQPFASTLDGTPQLRSRPMRRVTEPLRMMGANITDREGFAPLVIRPAHLHGIRYEMPVASAQVKSAVLLAGLYADGETQVIEPGPARDHTERMLRAMGAQIRVEDNTVTIAPPGPDGLKPLDMVVPGDISSAAFLAAAAVLNGDSTISTTQTGLNPTRTGILDVMRDMGAEIAVDDTGETGGEPSGTVTARSSALRAVEISGRRVVRMIDEIPVFAVMATQAEGQTVIRDAAELRVKEVDRIAMLAKELRRMGAEIREMPDGMIIDGPTVLTGARVSTHGDHRLGMALAVAGLAAGGETIIEDAGCIADSFPGFERVLAELGAEVRA